MAYGLEATKLPYHKGVFIKAVVVAAAVVQHHTSFLWYKRDGKNITFEIDSE